MIKSVAIDRRKMIHIPPMYLELWNGELKMADRGVEHDLHPCPL